MDEPETHRICMAIASMVPAQRFDAETPKFWQVPLAKTRYEDAREAVLRLVQRQQFVGVNDILSEVRVIRRERLARANSVVPNADPNDVRAWLVESRALTAAIADGILDVEAYRAGGWTVSGVAARPALPAGPERPMPELTNVLRNMPKTVPADLVPAYAPPPREVSPAEAAVLEEERARQLAAIEPLVEPEEGPGE